jgi:hypothetical protein
MGKPSIPIVVDGDFLVLKSLLMTECHVLLEGKLLNVRLDIIYAG